MTVAQAREEIKAMGGSQSPRAYAAQVNWTRATLRLLKREPSFPTTVVNDAAPHTGWVTPNGQTCKPNPWAADVYRLLRKPTPTERRH